MISVFLDINVFTFTFLMVVMSKHYQDCSERDEYYIEHSNDKGRF